jgi:hypothetical protein
MLWLLMTPIALAAGAAAYAVTCLVSPDIPCGRCGGTGSRRHPLALVRTVCGRCGGRGSRLRLGVRWWAARTGEAEPTDWVL